MFGLAIIEEQTMVFAFLNRCQSFKIKTDVIYSKGKSFVFIDDPSHYSFMALYEWGPSVRFMTIEEVFLRSLAYGPIL